MALLKSRVRPVSAAAQRVQRCRAYTAGVCVGLAALFGGGAPASRAAVDTPKEYQIKAVFLFNFVQFIEWPATAFPDAAAPIRIGVLGDDPFAGALDAVVEGETIRQRPIVIQRSRRFQDLQGCHLVFVCRSEGWQIATIVAACESRPVLTVGDMPDFARRGGAVAFTFEGQKIRFEINRAVAKRSGLKLSSQLLGLARIVGAPVEPDLR